MTTSEVIPSLTRIIAEGEARQERNAKAAEGARSYVLGHEREVEWHAEEARLKASVDLDARISAAKAARGVSFEPPAVPGDGWASSELRRVVAAAAASARDHFTTLVHAERELAEAKRRLGETVASPIMSRPAVQTTELREQIDLCDARFEYAYGLLERHRVKLGDPAFVAVIEELNGCAQSAFFTPYATDKDPEMEQIASAMCMMLDAFATIARRQKAKMEEHSRATTLTRELGFTRAQIGEENLRLISPWIGQGLAQRAMKKAADAWGRENGELDVTAWLPNFDSPWG